MKIKQHAVEILTVFGIILLLGLFYYIERGSAEFIKVKIRKTYSKVVSNGDNSVKNQYMVATAVETFKNVDSLLNGKFNSSDLQSDLIINKTYLLKVVGIRIPFFSSYRNVISVEKTYE